MDRDRQRSEARRIAAKVKCDLEWNSSFSAKAVSGWKNIPNGKHELAENACRSRARREQASDISRLAD